MESKNVPERWLWIAERGKDTFQLIILNPDEPGTVAEVIASGLTIERAREIKAMQEELADRRTPPPDQGADAQESK